MSGRQTLRRHLATTFNSHSYTSVLEQVNSVTRSHACDVRNETFLFWRCLRQMTSEESCASFTSIFRSWAMMPSAI